MRLTFTYNTAKMAFLGLSTLMLSTACIQQTAPKSKLEPIPTPESSQKKLPKNVIIFIGDGMGVSTVTAARIFDGQSRGESGEENILAFETFPNVALIKTYNTNAQVPDSAGTATAILSGYKTNIGAVNVMPDTNVKNMVVQSCILKRAPDTLSDKARKSGRSVGIISTARITHATPAAMYGHVVDRGWERDEDVRADAAKFGCTGLASQMLENPADIILGGGRRNFTEEQLAEYTQKSGHIYVSNAQEFRAQSASIGQGKMLGLFEDSHMSYEADRDTAKEPSLSEMTEVAIDTLSQKGNGYVLMVEAGRVDHAHHGTNAYRALRDMQALNAAVALAASKVGNDTLILVTADHSHVFSIAGYPARGNPILGLVRNPDPEAGGPAEDYALAEDGLPYTTLGYQNGETLRSTTPLTDNIVQAPDFQQQVAIPLGSETHAGEDVPLYATGPGSHNFKGVMEQDKIGQIVAALLGE